MKLNISWDPFFSEEWKQDLQFSCIELFSSHSGPFLLRNHLILDEMIHDALILQLGDMTQSLVFILPIYSLHTHKTCRFGQVFSQTLGI
jgi:hypothetical protein